MVLYAGGPLIPGMPSKPIPAKPAPAKKPSVNTTTLAGILAASKPKPVAAQPVTQKGVYVPVGAYRKDGTAVSPATIAKATEINKTIAPATPSRTTPAPTPSSSSSGATTGSSKTGSIETGIVEKTTGGSSTPAAEKPIQVVLDQEEMNAAQQAADALREFQKNQANMQLQQALGKIDRAAIEQYKGISEDYAARGLARSGGKLAKEQQAIDERDRAVGEARQAVTDFLNELKLTGNLEQASTNLAKSQAFQDYITGRLSPAMGG